MLSTGRMLRATKLLCDFKTIEGTKKCNFHVYAVKNSSRLRNYVLRRRQQPVAIGFVNFASSDTAAESTANATSQVLSNSMDDMKVLSELGIIPPFQGAFPSTAPESKMRETQDDLGSEGEVMMEINSGGIPSEVPELGEHNLISTVAFSEPTNELKHDISEVSEVLLESMFESSVIPEANSSPLDGSFEPIPSEEDPARTVDQLALETEIDPVPSIPFVEAPVYTPDISATTGGIPELSTTPPELLSTVAENVGRFGGEASLQSIGLGSWSPVGMVQQALEYFHVGLDLPWWGAIAVGTLIIRICVFPLVIMSQRNAAKMNNNLPEMQAIQLKMSEARERGDRLDAARYAQEMMGFMKTKGLNPLKNMAVPLCQAPFFVSMFMGIRGMANAPVESFREGGLWWFTDLTLPDQFYLLPLITSVTLALTVEVGTDMGRLNSSNMGLMKYFLRAMPVIIFPFTMNFPAGVLVYWCSTNFISLFQVAFLRIPAVRDYFKIDRIIKFDKKALPIKEKGFVGGMKESWTNLKISRELEERERLDNANFMRAGRGAIKKTYKFDPTQPRPPRNLSSIQLKKRD